MEIETQQRLGRLILHYMQGLLNEDEKQELERWRSASEEHEILFRQWLSANHWKQCMARFVKNEKDTRAEWYVIRRRTFGKRDGRRFIYSWQGVAAIVLLVLFLGIPFYKMQYTPSGVVLPASDTIVPGISCAVLELADGRRIDLREGVVQSRLQGEKWEILKDSLKYQAAVAGMKEEYHTLRVPRGGEYTLLLADGTKVFLNAASCLKYPVSFCGNMRRVKLEGEAFFEVAPNREKPFVVEVGQLQVKVLGTSFGVRSYEEDREIRTTLLSGKVNVLAGNESYSLTPSQQAVYDKSTGSVNVKIVDTELFTAWKNGQLIFDNCHLEDILRDLSRWYSFEVFYLNSHVKEIPFSLNIRKHEEFVQVLELLQNTGKIKCEIKKNTVIIR